MMYRFGAFDHYDIIFCVGNHHNNEIRKHEFKYSKPEKKLFNAGYYRLERIYQSYMNYKNKPLNKKRETVLIAPSWGDENILKTVGIRLIALLKNKYDVIVRPHPEILKRTPDVINNLEVRFRGDINVKFEKSVLTDDSIIFADYLICDCSGIAIEYAFGTERPVIFIDVPVKIKNERFSELEIEPIELELRNQIGVILAPENIESEILQVMKKLKIQNKIYSKRIILLRNHLIYNFNESSSVSAKKIVELMNTL
jgi:YidC/Oxa1 family membrane protein insertase